MKARETETMKTNTKMKTVIVRFDSQLGRQWVVVDRGTENGDCVEFSTKARATTFKQMVNLLPGETIQAKLDSFANGLIQSYTDLGFQHMAAVFMVDTRHF